MNFFKPLLLMLIILVAAFYTNGQTRENFLVQIATVENNFADDAAATNARDSFLRFSADNAVAFDPRPVNAKEFWTKKQPREYLINWRPNWVDVSLSGDIGFSTGSWSYHPKGATDKAVAWGEFFTIWRRQSDGKWLWVLDGGIDHNEAPVVKESWKSPNVIAANSSGKTKNTGETWQKLESDLAAQVSKNGITKTYQKLASEQIRLLRQNNLPMQGKQPAMSFLKQQNGKLTMKAEGGELVSDFAYAYGEYELTGKEGKVEKGHYTRVWKLEPKGWRITADSMKPVEEEK